MEEGFFVDALNRRNTGGLSDKDALMIVSLIEKLYNSEKKMDNVAVDLKMEEFYCG